MVRLRFGVALLLALGHEAAWGAPVAPDEAEHPVLVTTAAGPEIFHLLSGGAVLTFPVKGPRTVEVVARRRLPAASVTPPPVPVALLGDGQAFLTLQVGQPRDEAATARDDGGGVTSGADIARVDVPAGGLSLSVRSAAGAPDVYIRVDTRTD